MKIPEPGESVWTWLYGHRKLAGLVAFIAALVMMLVQLFKPFPEVVDGVLVAACQLIFYPVALVAAYFSFVYRPKASSQAATASHTPRAEEFWAEVKRRRQVYFLTWIGWLVVGLPLWKLYSFVIPAKNPMVSGCAALVTWFGVWSWTRYRVTSMTCFNCGHQALDRVPLFMRRARCSHCGTPYKVDQKG